MVNIREASKGTRLPNQPTGMPLFFEERGLRVVTADPWAYLKNLAGEQSKAEAVRLRAYIDQAQDFFSAAENPRTGSKPLLYYYSFLNLAKVALRLWGVNLPPRLVHGISDPAANRRTRMRLEGQKVNVLRAATNHSQVFPEFSRIFGGDVSRDRTYRVVDILAQVAVVHRTYVGATGADPLLLPVLRTEALSDGQRVWLRLAFSRTDQDVQQTLSRIKKRREFKRQLTPVRSEDDDEFWYETSAEEGRGRGVDPALRRLTESLYDVPFTAILTGEGYRYYICDVGARTWLHPLVAIYAVTFYLGSVTRYKPEDFGKIIGGGHAWVVEEMLATAPTQFLYMLCSSLAGLEVVRPFAVRPQ